MKKTRENLKVLWWSVKFAYKISPKEFIFWIVFCCLLAVLPSIALLCNRNVVSILSSYLETGNGEFNDIIKPILALGFILILTGISQRINGGFLYVVMYDNFYFGTLNHK